MKLEKGECGVIKCAFNVVYKCTASKAFKCRFKNPACEGDEGSGMSTKIHVNSKEGVPSNC